MVDIDKDKKVEIVSIEESKMDGIGRPVFSNDLDQTFIQTKDYIYQIMTNTKQRVETIKYTLDTPLESPVVNHNGDVYHKVGNQWEKKTFKFQSESTYLSI